MIFYNTAAAMLRAVGDSKTPLLFLIVTSVLSILLAILFVWGLGMGVGGAALASVIAWWTTAIICFVYMYRRFSIFRLKKADFVPDGAAVRAILRIALPAILQTLLLAVGDMIITSVVNTFGSVVVATFATGTRMVLITMTFGMNLAMANSVYAGQNFGAREIKRITDGFRRVAVLSVGISLAIGALVFFFGGSMVRFLIADTDQYIEEIVPLARTYLRCNAVFFAPLGLIWLYNYTLRGMGEVTAPFASSLTELVSKVALVFGLSRLFGHAGLWFVMPLAWTLGSIPPGIWFHMGRWKKRERRTAQ